MTEQPEGFHARDGWYFRRAEDGSVRLVAPDSMGPGAHQVVTLDANTWASVVASVSAEGETAGTFARARRFHDGIDYVLDEMPTAHKTGPTSVWLGDEEPVQGTVNTEESREVALGRYAYEAYCEFSGGKSLVSGTSLPEWEEQSPEIRGAWIAAAAKVETVLRPTPKEGSA